MQIQSIDNSNVKFKSRNKLDQVSAFVNMDDAQLLQHAKAEGYDKQKDKKNKKGFTKMLYALPLVDTLASGVVVVRKTNLDKKTLKYCRKAPLSLRTALMAKTAVIWGVGITAVSLYNLGKKAITANSEKAKKFEQNNPMKSFMIDIGVLMTAFMFGTEPLLKAVNKKIAKLREKSFNKNPEKFVENEIKANKKVLNAVDWLDNTKLNKVFIPKAGKFVKTMTHKAPFLAKTARFAAVNSIWVLLGLGLAKAVDRSKHEHNRVEKNYVNLKMKQLEAAKYLSNAAGVERDILAQSNIQLKSDLKQVMNEIKLTEHAQKSTDKTVKYENKTKTESKPKTKIIIIEKDAPTKSAKPAEKVDLDEIESEE